MQYKIIMWYVIQNITHYTGLTYQRSTAVCKTLSGNQKLCTVRTIFKINHTVETN